MKKEPIICAAIAGCMFCLGYLIAPETIEKEPEVKYIYIKANKNEMQNSMAMQYSNNLIEKALKINKDKSIKKILESCSEMLEERLKEYDIID